MSHFTRTQIDAVWINGYVVPHTDFESLDAKQFAGINGDLGGTWSPASNMQISGTTFGLQVTGPSVVSGPWGLLTAVVSLGIGDFPHLGANHVGRTRVLVQELSEARATAFPEPTDLTQLPILPRLTVWNDAYSAIQTLGTDIVDVQLGLAYGVKLTQELRVVDGSTLSTAEVRFRVPSPRAQAPVHMPRMRVVRRSTVDGSTVPLTSVAAGADANGYTSPPPVTQGAAWYAGGAAQGFVVVCDQNNAIDISQFVYFLEVIEESGQSDAPLAIRRWPDVDVVQGGTGGVLVLDENYDEVNAGPSVDGFPNTTGSRLLTPAAILDSLDPITVTDAVRGGIYIVQAPLTIGSTTTYGAIKRDPLFDGSEGSVVRVAHGTNRGTLYYQQQAPGPVSIGTTLLNLQPTLVGYGNVYHSAVLTFTGITDTRWQ